MEGIVTGYFLATAFGVALAFAIRAACRAIVDLMEEDGRWF